MFIFERMIGIGCFLFFLIAVCFMIIKSKYTLRQLLGGYTLVLAIMGFLYKPYETADLYRLCELMDYLSQQSFFYAMYEYVITTTTPAARFMCLIIGKIGVHGLLPGISVAITYFCIFYIVVRNAEIFSIKRKDVMLTVFFLMSTGSYMLAVSNVFTMLAMALVCFCFYRESVEKEFKWWHIAIYIIAALLHNLGAIVILIRVIAFFFSGKIPKEKVKIYSIAIVAVGVVLLLARPSLRKTIWKKVVDYIFEDSYFYFWEYLAGAITLALIIWCLIKVSRKNIRQQKQLGETKIFLFGCILVACALCMVFSFFHRFATYISPILCAPLLMYILRTDNTVGIMEKRSYSARKVVFWVSLVNLILVCTRGSLCSLKFFELP